MPVRTRRFDEEEQLRPRESSGEVVHALAAKRWPGRLLWQWTWPYATDLSDYERVGWLAAETNEVLAADLTPEFDGTLYLRINDGPDSRADNDGELKFKVVAE